MKYNQATQQQTLRLRKQVVGLVLAFFTALAFMTLGIVTIIQVREGHSYMFYLIATIVCAAACLGSFIFDEGD
jgi:hypothetical protein